MIDARFKKQDNDQKKTNQPQKSQETIRNDMNKKILNDILYYKLTQKPQTPAAPTNRSSDTNIDLMTSTQTISGDTVNNFKSLSMQMKPNPKFLIDYNLLNQRLSSLKTSPHHIFNFEDKVTTDKIMKEEKASVKEKALRRDLAHIVSEIKTKKSLQNQIREGTNQHMNEIKQLQLEVKLLVEK